MKSIKQQERDRKIYHKLPNKFSVHRSSLLVPVIGSLKTGISFLNHFVIKRNNKKVSVKISAYNFKGRCIDTYLEPLLEKKVYNYNLDDLFNNKKKIISYQIEFFSNQNLFIPYPAVIAQHISNKSHNVVHSYNRILNDKEEDIKINSTHVREGALEPYKNKDLTSGFIFHAGQNLVNSSVKIYSSNKNGKFDIKEIKVKLNPYNTKFFSLEKIIYKNFDNQVIFAEAPKQDFFYGRMLSGIFSKNKNKTTISANHTFYDSTKNNEYFENNESFMMYPYFERFENKLTFYPINSPSNLEVYIKTPDQKKYLCGNIKSPSSKILNIDINSIFKKNRLKFSMYELVVKNLKGKIPTRINHQFIVGAKNNSCKSSISNSLINDFVYNNLTNKKGFSWGPILIDSQYESFLSILNYSYQCENNEFQLKLYSHKGRVFKKKFKTSKTSPLILTTKDLSKYEKDLKGMCWYSIESTKNNIHGFSFHMNKKSKNISGEHSF